MDGDIKSIGDLKIVIDASTEQFSGNIKSARDMIAQFGTEGSASLSKFDGALLKTGEFVEATKGKLERFSAALPGIVGTLNRAVEMLEKLASVAGKSEDFDNLKNSITDLGGAVNNTFLTHFGAAGEELDTAKKEAVDYEEKVKEIGAQYGLLLPTVRAVSDAIFGVAVGVRALGGIDKMSAEHLDNAIVVTMKAIEAQKRIIEELNSPVRVAPVNEFIGDVGSIEQASTVLENLTKKLEAFKTAREALTAGPEYFDSTDIIENLRKQNIELELQTEVLGMTKEAADAYLTTQRALWEASRIGKEWSEEDRERLEEEVAFRREKMQQRLDFEAGIRDAERQRKERERQEKAIDDIDNRFEADLAQIQAKTLALTQSARAAEEMAYFERQMADARRKNIELTDADIEGIRAQAKAIADANEVMRQRQKELNRWQEDANMFSSNLLSEFSRWTQGAEFSWKRMVSNMLAEAARLMLLRNVLGPLFGGGGTDFKDSWFGSTFGGFRATGGPVEAGRSYLVGENGPEVVTMGANAHVTPAGKGDTFAPTINIDARGATADAVAMLEQRIPSIVMNTMTEARQRGLA